MNKKQCANMKPEFHSTVTVGTKGQIVIPKEVRERFAITPGDKLVTVTKGTMVIGFIKSDDLPKLKEYIEYEMQQNQ